MTRFAHDQFAKEYLQELLKPFGEVKISLDVVSEVREIDVFFMPSSPNPEGIAQLGLLATLSQAPTVFEPFRNPVQAEEIRSCLEKTWDLEAQLRRKANREEAKFSDRQIPQLWILSPTASEDLLRSFAAFPAPENYPPGIYPLASGFKAGIVVITSTGQDSRNLVVKIVRKRESSERGDRRT
ncbi:MULTISPECIES: hypothetical protein [unclassified Roseofilum]|uniref:hypothetical protein n=1 Tax=unclassified Roseofilum TaxID=2620099 RepID=UPI00298DC515|nr:MULTISPECIES: hypothetical protein [unclassified Roseofilum]